MTQIVIADVHALSVKHGLAVDHWRSLGATVREAACKTEDELVEQCRQATIVAYFGNDLPFSRSVLGRLERCLLVQRIAIGFDSVDIAAATELGIMVANCAGYCNEEVANHALALLLSCHQQISTHQRNLLSGNWGIAPDPPTERLSLQTLGIIGLGRIGRTLCLRASPLVERVVAYDPYITQMSAAQVGAELVDFDTLLSASDLVTLHCPLTAETRSMIDSAAVARMKPTACLVNTARGPIVDLDALHQSLRSGDLRGAGLDVFPEEPPGAPLHEIFSLPNVVVTPHAAAASRSALEDLWEIGSASITGVLTGKIPPTIVNPEVRPRMSAEPTRAEMPPERSHSVARQIALHEKACALIPGGTQLISRRPSRFAKGVSPVYAVAAKGARISDLDGNEYIDWVSGIGAIILGYCDPIVDEAVRRQIGHGTVYSINHDLEVELAEELVAAIPCAEMVRYAKGGGDACAVAVRIARGTTGRDRILFCGYHGWHDWYLAANLSAGSLDSHLFPQIEPIGVPRCLEGSAIPFPYGEAAALSDLLEKHRGEVAAVIMEPLRSTWPPQGYLEEVRALADQYGVVLIFDEVSTGLRFSAGGVQPAVGVTPDMAVFAKSMSNGYAMGAVVGRREVMEPAARMFVSSTYWSDTVGLRAALTTLREVRRREVPAYLERLGRELKDSLNQTASEVGCPVQCTGINVHPHLEFQVDDPALTSQLGTLYVQEMAKRGCHGYTSFYLNAAQGAAEIEQTVAAAKSTFTVISRAIEAGSAESMLECDPSEDSFRRLVK